MRMVTGRRSSGRLRLAGEGVKAIEGVGGGCGAEGVARAERIAHAGHGKGSPLSGGGEPHRPGSVARGGKSVIGARAEAGGGPCAKEQEYTTAVGIPIIAARSSDGEMRAIGFHDRSRSLTLQVVYNCQSVRRWAIRLCSGGARPPQASTRAHARPALSGQRARHHHARRNRWSSSSQSHNLTRRHSCSESARRDFQAGVSISRGSRRWDTSAPTHYQPQDGEAIHVRGHHASFIHRSRSGQVAI